MKVITNESSIERSPYFVALNVEMEWGIPGETLDDVQMNAVRAQLRRVQSKIESVLIEMEADLTDVVPCIELTVDVRDWNVEQFTEVIERDENDDD